MSPSDARREADARTRLRDAAIESFARRGLGATLRQIAADAGVTAGLITHHFGSKDALLAECDAEVLRRVRDINAEAMSRSPAGQVAMLAELDGQGATLAYLLRSLRDGGPAGRRFLENVIGDARESLAAGVANGSLRPSRDPDARARMLATWEFGGLLLQLTLLDDDGFADPAVAIQRLAVENSLPALELYTEGLLASRDLLDAYLAQKGTP